jgi:hypothetical protein
MGIGDWGLGIGDWPNPQSPIPNPHVYKKRKILKKFLKNYIFFIFYNVIKIFAFNS